MCAQVEFARDSCATEPAVVISFKENKLAEVTAPVAALSEKTPVHSVVAHQNAGSELYERDRVWEAITTITGGN